jgi:hypothetical protein
VASTSRSELVREDEGIRSQLVTTDPMGSGRTEYPVDTATFFLQWDPTSSRIAYLGNFRGSIGMGVAERGSDGEPTARTIVQGQPFYLSWSPEGERLLVHVGTRVLATLDLEGNVDDVGDRPGIFQGWSTRRTSRASRCSSCAATARRRSSCRSEA